MGVYQNGASALSGRYLVRNPILRTALTLHDSYLSIMHREVSPSVPATPRRLIVGIGGQLGDAVIATSAIRQIRLAFPQCEIGVMCTPAQAGILGGHPAIHSLHVVDHWFWGRDRRDPIALSQRWLRARAGRLSAIREITARGYEVSIDLYPFFPNGSTIFARARVPVRVGWTSGGGGPLLTHPVTWRDTRANVASQHTMLLQHCWPDASFGAVGYELAPLSERARSQGRALLAGHGITEGGFTLLHPGTSNALKRWPTEKWIDLLARIDGPVVLTGAGSADREQIDAIRAARPNAVSLCDQVDLDGLRFVIRAARAVISVDSVAAHLAAAEGRPTVVIASAMTDPQHWIPMGAHVQPLTAHVPCAPCFQTNGCTPMTCVRQISPSDVIDALGRAG